MSVGVFWRPCALQGSPERGRVENANKKVVRGVHPWTPQEHPKSIKINRNLKVRLCVGVGMRFLCPRCRQVWLDMLKTYKYNGFERISCLANFVFFMFPRSFWASFLMIWGVLGRHFGSQKVDAFFDRKTGTQVNPGIPRRRVQIP